MDMNQNNPAPEQQPNSTPEQPATPVSPVTPPPAVPVRPVNSTVPPIVPQQKSNDGMAIAAMVLGIIGFLISCCWFLSVPMAILAVVLGAVSLKKAKSGMAIAGIILGAVTLVAVLVVYVFAGLAAPQILDEIRKNVPMENLPSFVQ